MLSIWEKTVHIWYSVTSAFTRSGHDHVRSRPQKAVDNFDPQRKEMARDNIFLNADDIGSLEMSFFPLGVVEVLNALN